MISSHILGLPRIGENRELKFAIESFWINCNEYNLMKVGHNIIDNNISLQLSSDMDYITVGDFSWYDHVLSTLVLLGLTPSRFNFDCSKLSLQEYYIMARGNKEHLAMSMTKWFNTNYHYLIPEWTNDLKFNFKQGTHWLFDEIDKTKHRIKDTGKKIKLVLLGPLSLLFLGKVINNEDKLSFINKILISYIKLLEKIKIKKIDLIQIDEPILSLNLSFKWRKAFLHVYSILGNLFNNILLTTYFDDVSEYIDLFNKLPILGIHIDCLYGKKTQLKNFLKDFSKDKLLSLGIIDGRNIWRSNLYNIINYIKPLYKKYKNILISSSCSLLHVPIDLKYEKNIDDEIKNWLSFGVQKLEEINIIKKYINNLNNINSEDFIIAKKTIITSKKILLDKKKSKILKNIKIRNRLYNILKKNNNRKSNFEERIIKQYQKLSLPILPTTTIGSFPQTSNIRKIRKQYKINKINEEQYISEIKKEIKKTMELQDKMKLNVFVHGEYERNDMVEYFSDYFTGYLSTNNAWVQSYGSRCVKPPIIYGDISRKKPITINWMNISKNLTNKCIKGMLTGPVTMLQWSFVRNDQPRSITAMQIALAIRSEVLDLEKSNINIIQIDEPALREGLPLKNYDWNSYLIWAIKAFKISSSIVKDTTQIHTHICYSKFKDILEWIALMDADVISIETSRSNMKILNEFSTFNYPNNIGFGIYDIHSPRIPTVQEMYIMIQKTKRIFNIHKLWINPDCGLKTRKWSQVIPSIKNMIKSVNLYKHILNFKINN